MRDLFSKLQANRNWKKIATRSLYGSIAFLIVFVLMYSHLYGPTEKYAGQQEFLVTPEMSISALSSELKAQGFIRSSWALRLALLEKSAGKGVRPGGYEISKSMDTWSIATALVGMPHSMYITFLPGARKEQIADKLASELFWSEEQKQQFLQATRDSGSKFIEGVYYPDTYLIPSDQDPAKVAGRLRGRFTDVFSVYADEAKAKGMDWKEVLIMASLIEREASKDDRELVAGILWNRLTKGMLLQVDATLQYAKGGPGNWWPTPTSADKYIESPFNTYQHEGLPPHPISNPSLLSIEAAINPEKTNCLYYLHDDSHGIHCSVNYAGQKKNVNKYLK